MSRSTSPSTGSPYGIQRICKVWEFPRSSFYHLRSTESQNEKIHHHSHTEPAENKSITVKLPPKKTKRGPKCELSDEDLLGHIRRSLSESPFHGIGCRKVYYDLKYARNIKVGLKRVLRIMREHLLLSPHRRPKADPKLHDGKIITAAPNIRWGTDFSKIATIENGWVNLFTVNEHWNAEVLAWSVTSQATRHEAFEVVRHAVTRTFGRAEGSIALGLELRHDHGSQYMADFFQQSIRHLGIATSPSPVREPQGNGVSESFFGLLKKQIVNGRTYRNLAEVRAAVAKFIDDYNAHWRLQKLKGRSPLEFRLAHSSPNRQVSVA